MAKLSTVSLADIPLPTKIDMQRTIMGAGAPVNTVTENGLRATRTYVQDANYYNVCSTPATDRWDLLYFEATMMLVSSGPIVGICNKSHDWNYPGANTYSMGDQLGGQFYYNGALGAGNFPTFATGDTIAIAVRLTEGTYWICNITTNGFWNGAFGGAGADPAAAPPAGGTTGYAFMYNAGPLYACAGLYAVNELIRFNFDGTFLGTVPAGYRRWNGQPV